MRIISWNMGCAPIRARYRKYHSEAWQYLLDALLPDICLVQEALHAPKAMNHHGQLFWSADKGSDTGTAVWLRDGLAADPFTIHSAGSYVAGVIVPILGADRCVVSIHVGPSNYRRHLRALSDQLGKHLAGRPFVAGGDLNAARHVDAVYGGKWYTRYFDALGAEGFHDCHWGIHGQERQSFWGPQTKNSYQCDHIFVDDASKSLISGCQFADDSVRLRALSDHDPLLLVLAIPLPAEC